MEATLENKQQRAFTLKSLTAGLIGVLLIAGGSKFSPTLAKQALLEHQLGIGIYFYFFLICLLWNPFCSRFIPKLALNIKELAVAMVMTLAAGGFAWYGWLRQFYIQMVMMPQNGFNSAAWGSYTLSNYVNKAHMLNGGELESQKEGILGAFISGSGDKDWISLDKVPFSAWIEPLCSWGVLILLVALMCLALLLIVHRQWIRNEKLTYPLATVAESLFQKSDEKNHFADLFRSQLFWFAFIFVIVIHGYNYFVAANPTSGFAKIDLMYPLAGLSKTFPIIEKAGCGDIFTSARLMFLIVGIAYFLAPSLSISVGLNGLVYLLFAAEVYEVTGAPPSNAELQVFRAGAYLAFVIMLIILGRRYYGSIFWKAISWTKVEEEDKAAVLGARLFLLTALGSVGMLVWMGLDVPMAVSVTLLLVLTYLVFTRIVCEAGIPMMVAPYASITFFSKIFGGSAMGPNNLMLTGQHSGIFFGDMKQLLMPYLATGMKLTDDAGVKLRKVAAVVTITILVAFGVAFCMHLWQYYSMGVSDTASKSQWSIGVTEAVSEINRLGRNQELDKTAEYSVMERIVNVEPEKKSFIMFFLLGLGAVFLTGFMRTRFLWWPFHAVIFCIWKTAPANSIWFSFLLAWCVRTLIVRLGGEKNYIRMKPFFLGLIFGEIGASGLILLYGVIHYLVMKTPTTTIYQV